MKTDIEYHGVYLFAKQNLGRVLIWKTADNGDQNAKICLERQENIVGKRGNAGYHIVFKSNLG